MNQQQQEQRRTRAVLRWRNGVYKGEVTRLGNGEVVPCGLGVFESPTLFLLGDFYNSEFTGRGLRRCLETRTIEEGKFRNGDLHGRGIRITKTERYEGGFVLGRKHGWGVWDNEKGEHIEGVFCYDSIRGHLRKEEPNGDVFEGYMLGIDRWVGILLRADGSVYSGVFANNRPISIFQSSGLVQILFLSIISNYDNLLWICKREEEWRSALFCFALYLLFIAIAFMVTMHCLRSPYQRAKAYTASMTKLDANLRKRFPNVVIDPPPL
eukprot:TRINITY_DN9750_c0_g1_i1.p1 TRINITY_DN9750_c0_g1~~TRINITY_DN9750_c0_g1_i1.p1  ORF type:complete len:282 (-),score=33.19 TRINITY_DN9750_c0_g1_i1:13-813(-)